MTATDAVTLWRCSQCGKWSHALRRPAHHERVMPDDEPDEGVRVLRVEQNGVEADTGAPQFSLIVACGPFDEYHATRIEATS